MCEKVGFESNRSINSNKKCVESWSNRRPWIQADAPTVASLVPVVSFFFRTHQKVHVKKKVDREFGRGKI